MNRRFNYLCGNEYKEVDFCCRRIPKINPFCPLKFFISFSHLFLWWRQLWCFKRLFWAKNLEEFCWRASVIFSVSKFGLNLFGLTKGKNLFWSQQNDLKSGKDIKFEDSLELRSFEFNVLIIFQQNYLMPLLDKNLLQWYD